MTLAKYGSTLRQFLKRMASPGGDTADGVLLDHFCTHRDDAAFADLVRRHGPMVFGVCKRVLHDDHDAEDAFQATFLALARKAGTLDRNRPLACWLHTVACNMALKLKAGSQRQQLLRQRKVNMPPPEQLDEENCRELRQLLDAELNRLPDKYRAPLVLCYLEGKTNEAAARELGWPAGSIAKRLERGRELLRESLSGRAALSAGLTTVLLTESTRAAVSPALVAATSQAAATFAATGTAAAASARAAALAREVLKSMSLTKLKTVGVVLLSLGILGGGAGVIWQTGAADQPAPDQQKQAADQPAPKQPPAPPEDPRLHIRAKLASPVTLDGFDRNTPLKEAVEFFAERYAFKITYDRKALTAAGIKKLEQAPIKMCKVVNLPLSRVLELVLREASDEAQAVRYRIRPDGIEITTARTGAVIRGTRFARSAEDEPGLRQIGELRDKFDALVSLDGFEANTPLKEALGFFGERYGFTISMDVESFNRAGIQEPENQPIKLPAQRNVPLASLMGQVLLQGSARFRLRGGSDIVIGYTADLHAGTVFSADGQRLATACLAGKNRQLVRVWDRRTGGELGQVPIVDQDLAGFCFTADGKALITAGHNLDAEKTCTWSHWNAFSGKKDREQRLRAAGRFALSPDGQQLAYSAAGAGKLLDIKTETEQRHTLAVHGDSARIAFSGDGRTIIALDRRPADLASTVFFWSPGTGSQTRFRLDAAHGGGPLPAASVTLSHDGRLLASVDCLGRLGLWEVVSGRCIRGFKSPALVHAVAFSPDDRLLAAIVDSTPGHIEVRDVSTGKALVRLLGSPDAGLLSLAFSPDGKTLAACTDDGAPIVWDVSDLAGSPARTALTADQLHKLWKQLSATDPDTGRQAILALGANPVQAVPFLRARLQSSSRAKEDQHAAFERNLKELDHDEFARREQAQDMLLRLGSVIAPRLRKELDRPLPSLELRRRIERILQRLQEPVASPEVLRELRTIEILERAGTREAVQLLESLAKETPDSLQTLAARTALEQLARRKSTAP